MHLQCATPESGDAVAVFVQAVAADLGGG